MPIAKRVVRTLILTTPLVTCLASCVAKVDEPAKTCRPTDSMLDRAWEFPAVSEPEWEAMRLAAQEWHNSTRNSRGVRDGGQWNYVCLFHIEISFKQASLHREPTVSWIWGVRDLKASCVRMGFDTASQPIVVEEVEHKGRSSLSFDDVQLNYRQAIETAESELGNSVILLFRLGWSGEGAYRLNEVLYPSSDDCVCWEVQTRASKRLRFNARTFKTITD